MLLAQYARPITIDVTPEGVPQPGAGGPARRAPWTARTSWPTRPGCAHDLDEARRELLLFAGLPVLRVEMVGATLEDIFLSLTNNARLPADAEGVA